MVQKSRIPCPARVISRMKSGDAISHLAERLEVLRAQQGDAEAFRRLVECYERRMLYYILRLVDDGDQTLDILQEVWLSVFRLLPKLEAPEAFRVWIYRIAHGKVMDFLRRQRRIPAFVDGTGDPSPELTDYDEPALENAELVHRALGQLSVEHREVLTLHFLEGMRLEEIAQTLSCPLGTVKSRMYHAKRSLRNVVERLNHGGR
jgi:RNA polymerase sigma-70 factor (ECF subfamily)